MVTYTCNHCGKTVKNNGGSAKEVGMLAMGYYGFGRPKGKEEQYYCYGCAKEIAEDLLDELV